ncbi:type II CRISPR RNA-guided endonuclease Cas9 [Helicobacter sp. faydin-H20]|uniref:type II CRISPR RNA-guided endonuclease Cas9 n=1 Tax=Helicobacter anatolicus TaxID=2905874 RepID=UPI001E2DDF41|nr:type II CRISPR RNA-guided endonuclease Cas9 [Helicobacter anatolicus]MCE3036833.1 type II CRISPR RNA-guided endonuclease Cas9 [Helicobacter anatolicus]
MAVIRTLGVDIGIASIGWALVESDDSKTKGNNFDEDFRIVDSGVRIFTKAENPKDKSSLALPRRCARSARRRNARRSARMQNIKRYLSETFNVPLQDFYSDTNHLPKIFSTSKSFCSPWELRTIALDKRLEDIDLVRVILHIAKHRGYDDITYGMKNEDGKIKKAIAKNQEKSSNYRSVCEMLYKEYFLQGKNVRNRAEKDHDKTELKATYHHSIGRSELERELRLILEKQKELGNEKINDVFMQKILGAKEGSREERGGMIFYQRPLKSFEGKVGKCEFFKDKIRACKCAPSAEKFIAITKIINTLAYISNQTGLVWDNKDTIKKILEGARKTNSVSYKKLRKILELPETFQFREIDYSSIDPENKKFIELEYTHKLSKINPKIDEKLQDRIAQIMGVNKDWGIIEEKLAKEIKLSREQIESIKEKSLKFSKTINLSLEALDLLLPEMEKGKRYDEAVKILQDEKKIPKKDSQKNQQDILPSLDQAAKEDDYFNIKNPVVLRALSEFIKVVNAILKKYGSVHYFNIELTREVGKSKEERNKDEKWQKNNERDNKEAEKICEEIGLKKTSKNILKCKLWYLQKEICIYSGKKITSRDLTDTYKIEVDHIIPRSRSLDNSQSNKVLCFKEENQNKGKRIPYEYFGEDAKKWEAFKTNVANSCFDEAKKKRLMRMSFKDRNSEELLNFLSRNLVDTGYINRVVSLYVKQYFKFLPLENKVEHLRIVSGSLTSAMRCYWGLGKKNREHHLHHAQDAIIIACINQRTIQRYSEFLREKEERYKSASYDKARELSQEEYKKKIAFFPPTSNFIKKVEASMEKIFVSHSVSKKVTGALHEETIEKKANYIKMRNEKAKYTEEDLERDLALGKIREINGGIVKNANMIRVDIFRKKNKKGREEYYAVPIYTYDVAIGKLPNKSAYSWIEMNEDYEFCFSLFKNDCVRIQKQNMSEPTLAIFKSLDSSTASMEFVHHSGEKKQSQGEKEFFGDKNLARGVGIKTLKELKKMEVGVLGEVRESRFAKRLDFSNKRKNKDLRE